MANFKYDQQKRFIKNIAPKIEEELGGGGGSSENSTGVYLNDGSGYTLSVDFKALKKFIVDNNIDLSAEITEENYNAVDLMIGLSATANICDTNIFGQFEELYFSFDSGEIQIYCSLSQGGSPLTLGTIEEHTTIMDVIDMACEKDGGVYEYGEVYFDNMVLTLIMGFRQGSDEGLPVCRSISRADWEKIFIMTPANQGE